MRMCMCTSLTLLVLGTLTPTINTPMDRYIPRLVNTTNTNTQYQYQYPINTNINPQQLLKLSLSLPIITTTTTTTIIIIIICGRQASRISDPFQGYYFILVCPYLILLTYESNATEHAQHMAFKNVFSLSSFKLYLIAQLN